MRIKFYPFILLLVLHFVTDAEAQLATQGASLELQPQGQQGWVQVPSGTTYGLSDLSFVSKDTAFTGDYKPMRSTDGGFTWQPFAVPQPWVLSFYNNLTGLLVNSGPSPGLYYTHDGGQNWTIVNDSNAGGQEVCWISADTAYMIGDHVNRTTDGGKTWSSARAYAGDILAGAFYDSQHGITVGRVVSGPGPMHQGLTASCYTTGDGGISWTQQYTGVEDNLISVSYISTSIMVAVGGTGSVTRSKDAGITWESIKVFPSNYWTAIRAKDGRILAVGWGGAIITSLDSGLTWAPESTGITSNLYSIAMLDDGLALASGDSGVILRTTNGGTDWVQVAPPALVQLLTRVRYISETPFIEIEYSLPQLQDVTIRLFDLLGKEIETLQARKLEPPGSHTIRFDTSHLPSGTYLYRIETERYSGAGKFVIAK